MFSAFLPFFYFSRYTHINILTSVIWLFLAVYDVLAPSQIPITTYIRSVYRKCQLPTIQVICLIISDHDHKPTHRVTGISLTSHPLTYVQRDIVLSIFLLGHHSSVVFIFRLLKVTCMCKCSQCRRNDSINSRPHPIIPQDLMDNDGNLRATDIGIIWAGSDTFLHGVKVVGPAALTTHQPTGPRPATSTPYQLVTSTPHQPTGPRPATSTPYQPVGDHSGCDMSSPRQPPTFPTGPRPATSTPYQPAASTPHPPTGPQPATSTPYQTVGDHGGCDRFTQRQPPTLPTCLEIPDTCAPLR